MKRLLLVILSFLIMTGAVLGAQNVSDEVIAVPLSERIKNHPDAVQMAENWYRIVIKENISNTEFDWRFDLRMIDVMAGNISIGHRFEQNSGNIPNSNWVIDYVFIDDFGDGTLDYFDKDRFITVQQGDAWLRIRPSWPDKFRYPDLISKDEALKMYKKELEYWENKL